MMKNHFFVYISISNEYLYDADAVNFWNEKITNIKNNDLYCSHYMISDTTTKDIIENFKGNYMISWNYNTILKNIYIFDQSTAIQFKLRYNLSGETIYRRKL